MSPSGADLEYARMLRISGGLSGAGLDGARLEQLADGQVSNFARLRRTKVKLGAAKAGTGKCKILVIGDSTDAGYGGVAGVSDWPTQLGKLLASVGYPQASEFMGLFNNMANARITLGAGWGNQTLSLPIEYAAPGNVALTYCIPLTATALPTGRIWFFGNSDNWAYDKNGHASIGVVPNGLATLQAQEIPDGLNDGAHYVGIARQGAGAAGLSVLGAEIDIAAAGVTIYNCAVAGVGSDTAGGNNLFQAYFPAVLAGINPDLVVLGLGGINDIGRLVTLDSYEANQQWTIDKIKAQGSDLILRTQNDSVLGNIDSYTSVMRNLAVKNNAVLCDVYGRAGGKGSYALENSYGAMYDGYHPNPAGYADVAAAMKSILLG